MITTGFFGLLEAGDDIEPNYLVNLAEKDSLLALMANLAYCTFIIFHLPTVFQCTKEYLLLMWDEYMNDTMKRRVEAQQHAID